MVRARRTAFCLSLLALSLLVGCGDSAPEPTGAEPPPANAPALPSWTFDESMILPADRSLARPEDGVALADGRVLIADQAHDLRLLADDGSHEPFGQFADAGYEHSPPEIVGGPNGVTLEPNGRHVLVSDVYRGGLYRVAVETGETERIYQHPYGINMARRDSRGGIWFSQSTENNPAHGEVELFESVGVPVADGALFYIAPDSTEATQVASGLNFANGLVLDEANGFLYVSETMGSRLHRFDLDLEAGTLSGQTTATEVSHPDNIEMDRHGRIWIASAVRSEIQVFDPATGSIDSVLRVSTPESEAQIEEIEQRLHDGVTWVDLITPPLFEPAPGVVTGMILAADGETALYATGLGNAVIRLGS